MATSTFKYCSQRDVKDVYPNIDEADDKVVIRNFTTTDTANQYQANNTGLITQLFIDGVEGTSVSDSPDANYEFNYSSSTDSVQLFLTSDPNESLIEAGEDWATLIDRMIVNCSMELSSMLDARFPRPIPKAFQYAEATDGSDTPEYDYIVKRATALLVAHHLLIAKDPTSEIAEKLMFEVTNSEGSGIVDRLNEGRMKLAFEIDSTDQSGDIVEVTRAGSMYLVETIGSWIGALYDRIKIKCSVAGAYGVCKVDVYALGNNKIAGSQILDDYLITGGLQEINGLYFRFEGNSMSVDDEWHVIVRNYALNNSNAGVRSIKATHSWRTGKRVGEE